MVRSQRNENKQRKPKNTGPVTKEFTINLKKKLHKCTYKKKAPRAMRYIRKVVSREMNTTKVIIDDKLNKAVWSKGIRSIPFRIRVMASRKRREDDEVEDEMYSLVTVSEDQTTKGRPTEIISDV